MLQKFFVKKIKIVLIASIYYTTYVYPPQLLYGELIFTDLAIIFFLSHLPIFICAHLILLVNTFFYLSEPISICVHLLWSVKISS